MLIAGNWKMNTDRQQAAELAKAVVQAIADPGEVLVAVCPPFVNLEAVGAAIAGSAVRLGAQNMHAADAGAYTGEISASMLNGVGCHFVILGHSERRQYFGETDAGVAEKAKQAMDSGLVPIVCVGETLEERDSGEAASVVERQIRQSLAGLEVADASKLVVAYEPVWAIGTGRTASPEQAQDMHAHIRGLLNDLFGPEVGRKVHILYGGSMKPGNATELLGLADVDGGLIGGAALKADDFAAIVRAGKGA